MKIIVGIIIALALTAGITAGAVLLPRSAEEVLLEIKQGTPAVIIAERLQEEGVIRSKYLFLIYIRLMGIDKQLSYGEFHFLSGLNLPDVVYQLREGKVKLHPVTVIEGLTIRQTSNLLKNAGLGDYDVFLSLCKDSSFVMELTGLSLPTLEGFLYPTTYFFPRRVTERYVLRTMVNEFFKQTGLVHPVRAETESERKKLDRDFYDKMILASIVEKEATFDDEKPLIAGVYSHRLRIGKRLQADPTVAYVLRKQGIVRKVIYYRDLKVDSPYNTYRNNGLPPAPICSPAITSINAALNPEDTEYLFFFANNRGRHIFTRTYREHLNRQREMRQQAEGANSNRDFGVRSQSSDNNDLAGNYSLEKEIRCYHIMSIKT